jgi:hypothetical protein
MYKTKKPSDTYKNTIHIADSKQNFSAFVEWKEELVSVYSSSLGGGALHCFTVSKAPLKVIIIQE